MNVTKKIRLELQSQQKKGLYRSREMHVQSSREFINFSSNDYLSLSTDAQVSLVYQKGFKQYPSGSGGSMVLGGYSNAHRSVEKAFAEFLGVEDALLLTSGYAANLAVVALLNHYELHSVIDKALHASFYDGLALQNAAFTRYRHQDMDDLVSKLKHVSDEKMVITEGLFSMSGQLTDLDAMATICDNYSAHLLVDEAHSFGIMGDEGRGVISNHKLPPSLIPLRIIPLGKAFASQGAMIAGQREWIEALIQVARSYIYSTGISPAIASGMQATLNIVQKANDRRRKLNQLVGFFQKQVRSSFLTWTASVTPVQQLKLGCTEKALYYSERLKKQGILALPVRPPTATKKNTGLRIILNYHHQPEDILKLFNLLHGIQHDSLSH